jgi:hypothetical protein
VNEPDDDTEGEDAEPERDADQRERVGLELVGLGLVATVASHAFESGGTNLRLT